MDFRHLIVTCLFSKLRLPFDNQKVKENYAIFLKEEQIFQAARDLAAEIGISYSEALGFTLGIKDVTYGWEEDYTEEEFQALIDHAVGDTDYEHTLY